ncbi:hypothetical protein Q3G72_023711 [Acer saccharum]|nr:hypothetical protein Q3G72_023711 [Acer saccharum]
MPLIQDEEDVKAIARLFADMGDSYVELIANGLEESMLIVHVLLDVASHPQYDIASMTFNFWHSLQVILTKRDSYISFGNEASAEAQRNRRLQVFCPAYESIVSLRSSSSSFAVTYKFRSSFSSFAVISKSRSSSSSFAVTSKSRSSSSPFAVTSTFCFYTCDSKSRSSSYSFVVTIFFYDSKFRSFSSSFAVTSKARSSSSSLVVTSMTVVIFPFFFPF